MSVLSTQFGSVNVSDSGYVSNLFVRNEARGQGHGSDLMRQVTDQADATGQTLHLNAKDDLHPFYRRLGFEPTGDTDLDTPRLQRQPQRKA